MARRDRGRPVVEDDWFRVRWIADPDLSSEGRRVAYEVAYLDRDADRIGYQVHWREVDGAAGGCLTAPGTADRAPRWAPDGPRVAVLADEGAGSRAVSNPSIGHPTGVGWSPWSVSPMQGPSRTCRTRWNRCATGWMPSASALARRVSGSGSRRPRPRGARCASRTIRGRNGRQA